MAVKSKPWLKKAILAEHPVLDVFQVGIGFGDTCPVNVGDKVMYHKLCGVELEFDGVVYLVMRLTDIIALL